MSTFAIIRIIAGALIGLALVGATIRARARDRRYEERREAAGLHRAEADEHARVARREREAAEAHEEHAERLDPDYESGTRRE